MPDGEQVNPTLLLRQATVRGSSFEAPVEVMFQDIEYAGRSYPVSHSIRPPTLPVPRLLPSLALLTVCSSDMVAYTGS